MNIQNNSETSWHLLKSRKRFNFITFSGKKLPPNVDPLGVFANDEIDLVSWMVVAQLAERSLMIPEIHGSNPVNGKKIFIFNICLLSTVC